MTKAAATETRNEVATINGMRLTADVYLRLAQLGYTADQLRADIEAHEGGWDDKPAVYVGTYAKYSAGDLRGMWVDLTSFDSFEKFHKFCLGIHADEDFPELMAQDYEYFPESYYSESIFNEKDFEKILRYKDLCDEYGENAVKDFFEISDNLDNFENAFCGYYETEEDYARFIVSELGNTANLIGELADILSWDYFDYAKYGRDLFLSDYHHGSNGYVFNRRTA